MVELQNRLYNNVLEGVQDATADKTLNDNVNHIKWLAGHLLSTRCTLVNLLGHQVSEPYPALFEKGKGIDRDAQYPSLAELTNDWDSISEKLQAAVTGMTDEALAAEAPIQVPVADRSVLAMLTFFMHHEAYHIGQMGILRKYAGMEPMAYK